MTWDGSERREDYITRGEHDTVKEWVKGIAVELGNHTKAEARMDERIAQIEQDLQEIKTAVSEIRDMISRAKGIWAFLGWSAGVIAALAGFVAWAKEHMR